MLEQCWRPAKNALHCCLIKASLQKKRIVTWLQNFPLDASKSARKHTCVQQRYGGIAMDCHRHTRFIAASMEFGIAS